MYEYPSYTEWVRDDVKGTKKTIFIASVLISSFSMICGLVLLIFLLIAYREHMVGTPLTVLELVTLASWVVAIVSYFIHDFTNTLLSKEYDKYVFEKLYGESMLFG